MHHIFNRLGTAGRLVLLNSVLEKLGMGQFTVQDVKDPSAGYESKDGKLTLRFDWPHTKTGDD